MKRYDNDEQMHAALEVFLFDTLTDTDLEFASDVPAEAAAEERKPASYFIDYRATDGSVTRYDKDSLPGGYRNANLFRIASAQLGEAHGDDVKRHAIKEFMHAIIDAF